MELISLDSPLAWIQVTPAAHPQFPSTVQSLVGSNVAAEIASVLPYSVIVTNAGAEVIVGIDVRFSLKASDRLITENFFYNSFSQPERPLLPPGRSILVTPLRSANARAGGAPDRGGFGRSQFSSASDATSMQQLASAAEIRISIDLVVGIDGRTAGPDLAKTVKKQTARWSAYRAMREDCLARLMAVASDASIEEWLTRLANQMVVRDPETGWGDEYTATQKTLASEWLSYLSAGRRSDLARELSNNTPDLRYPMVGLLKEGLR